MAKVIFFGTPEYVIPIPEALKNAGHEIVAVVTQPPKPVGRKQILIPSPVAQWAEKHNIPAITDLNALQSIKADIGVLAAYGRIIPKEVINHFPRGILNVHPSLLPQWRGASPVQAAIASGSTETGVSIIKLDKELDHGPILFTFPEKIRRNDTTGTLRVRLFKKFAGLLAKAVLPGYLNRAIQPREQAHNEATFTKVIKKDYGYIPPEWVKMAMTEEKIFDLGKKQYTFPWMFGFPPEKKPVTVSMSDYKVRDFIRAFNPWPNVWTYIKLRKNARSVRIKLLEAHIEEKPGSHIPISPLILYKVQLEGKKPVTWKQFKEGYPEVEFS